VAGRIPIHPKQKTRCGLDLPSRKPSFDPEISVKVVGPVSEALVLTPRFKT
jgi:hypothetical protein